MFNKFNFSSFPTNFETTLIKCKSNELVFQPYNKIYYIKM